MTRLFPFGEYWWFYAAFAGLIAVLLALDLWAHRKTRPLSMRTATAWIFLDSATLFVLGCYCASRDTELATVGYGGSQRWNKTMACKLLKR